MAAKVRRRCEHRVSPRRLRGELRRAARRRGFLTAQSRTPYGAAVTRRLTQRGQDRRDQLMAFATSRFAEQGYHPTSVSEIVAGRGVGKGGLYWYFDSKERLFIEILSEAKTDLRRKPKQASVDEPNTRPEE